MSGMTFNGTVTFHYNDISNIDAGYSFTYTNFTVTDPTYGTTTIDMTVVCTNRSNCTYNSDFAGSDGVTYRVTNSNISGDASNGFYGSATFYNGTYGEVTISISGITYGNCGTFPDGGNISFSSSNGSSGTITFNSNCTVSGTWSDGAGASGNWSGTAGGGSGNTGLAGTWSVTSTTGSNTCGDLVGVDYTSTVNITVSGSNVTGGELSGTVNGNQVSLSGSYPDDGGTTTSNISLTVDGNLFSGTDNWSWTGGGSTCTGTDSLSGTKQ